MSSTYDALALASGGARGIVALGALDELFRRRYLTRDAIKMYSGSSIGAVLAAGLALGRSPRGLLAAVQAHVIQTDFAPANFGLDGGRGLRRWIARLLRMPASLTFEGLYERTGKILVVCVCNLDKRRAEHWSRETHADVSVLDALRISCSVPGVFAGVRFRGQLYVDGAVSDPFPVPRPGKWFGIRFDKSEFKAPVVTLQDFISALVESHAMPRRDLGGGASLVLRTGDVDPLDFAMPAPRLRAWFARGSKQAAAFVKKNQ